MATTDSRTGFRLPWSTDRAASRDASAVPVDELATAASADVDGSPTPTLDPGDPGAPGATGDGPEGREEEAVTILAPDPASTSAEAEAAAPASDPAEAPAVATAGQAPARGGHPDAALHRRPTKFLADLMLAMHAAAEQARTATLDQFRGDGAGVIEQIHTRSASGATELRRHADNDVAAIKDWSKAEIARIRDETERRIGARREQLEGQLERHAALVEHEIEKVRGRLASFEAEMGQFFDDLVSEEDPSVFAAHAAGLPEPPTFEDLDDDAMTALLREPGVGVPEPAVAVSPWADVEAPALPEDSAATDDSWAPPEVGTDGAAQDAPGDREAALAAIRAAAEAAAGLGATEALAEAATGAPVEAAGDATPPDLAAPAATEPEVDPRLAMLGLTPDFAAAEIAAVEMAAAEVEDVVELGGDALAARLSGLVPGDAPAAEVAAVTTRVVVTGLVSVASIASFKRHMGRLAGVRHVGVSSGPDAEFVFAVAHDPATSLRDLIPTLSGFAARVVGVGEGFIQVSAQDPQG